MSVNSSQYGQKTGNLDAFALGRTTTDVRIINATEFHHEEHETHEGRPGMPVFFLSFFVIFVSFVVLLYLRESQ
jgi:heme/copper-type cytochrome/quinol oxidase subunit 3